MAYLKIHSDIVSEEDRIFMEWWGLNGTSFDSVDSFIDSIDADDNQIELRLNCRGGSVMEGWAIYDKLRATGKEITAIIEGKCASMATIILLAAPKERRSAYQNSKLLIHNPYIPAYGITEDTDAARLEAIAADLRQDEEKILDEYVARTGADREELRTLMSENNYLDMNKAKELGFIAEIKPHASAKQKSNMKTVNVGKRWLDKVLAKAGYSKIEDAQNLDVVAMDLTTADGSTLTVEREEGEPQVGDAASPDGEHLMPEGETIVVVDGVITEIRPEEDENNDDETEALKAENEALKAEVEELKKNAKSSDDVVILNRVKMLGGLNKLNALAKGVSSNYQPAGRTFTKKKEEEKKEDLSPIDKKLAAEREKRLKK